MQRFDLRAMGQGSADYLHLLIEATKLAFADREQYYGDPSKAMVPAEVLLSESYARGRAELIDMRRASDELRPGDAWHNAALLPAEERFTPQPWGPGTVHVDAVDAKGNMASFTPSGAWIKSAEVIGALGFPLSTRMMTFYLGPANHPNVVAPGKRPRTTLTPSLAFRRGRPWMTFGTMGGDQQEQWSLQFILYREAFGMTIQQAIEAPSCPRTTSRASSRRTITRRSTCASRPASAPRRSTAASSRPRHRSGARLDRGLHFRRAARRGDGAARGRLRPARLEVRVLPRLRLRLVRKQGQTTFSAQM